MSLVNPNIPYEGQKVEETGELQGVMESFQDFGFHPGILRALSDLGYQKPSPIQQACLPTLLNGQDVLGMAQTGSGKTAAFCLPGLQNIDLSKSVPQMLVLTPTRELAIQVAQACASFAKYLPGVNIATIYGGQSYEIQRRALNRGPQVIVGTPGRLIDSIQSKVLDLSQLSFLVLDEADEMLRMGFIEAVDQILESVPVSRQTSLFSATMPPLIRKITHRFMRMPKEVRIQAQTRAAPSVDQHYCLTAAHEKNRALIRFLEVESFDAAIIFVKTKSGTLLVAKALENEGHRVAALNGDMTQSLREQTLQGLRMGSIDLLVATDVAARGLDVDRIGWVINYDMPPDSEAYVHRVGRTGRAGRAGRALLFVEPSQEFILKRMERSLSTRIEFMPIPDAKALKENRVSRFSKKLAENLEDEKGQALYAPILESVAQQLDQPIELIATALLRMAQQRRPLVLPPDPPKREVIQKRSGAESAKERWSKRSSDRTTSGAPTFFKPAGKPRARQSTASEKMAMYRVELGRSDGLEVKHVVGALMNEGQLTRQDIGNIKLLPSELYIELASGLTSATIKRLSKIRVLNRPLKLMSEHDTA